MCKEETLRLWEWERTFNDGPLEYDGSCISFKDDERHHPGLDVLEMNARGRILTSNPVPKDFETFDFSAEIKGGGTHQNIAVGYATSSTSSIVYEGISGKIVKETWKETMEGRRRIGWKYSDPDFWTEQRKVKTLLGSEPFGENDIIKCCVRRKNISEREYTLISFKKNDNIIGQEALKGRPQIWPVISVGLCEAQIQVEMDITDTTHEHQSGKNSYF